MSKCVDQCVSAVKTLKKTQKLLVHARRQGLISDKNVQKYSNQKDFKSCTTVVNTHCMGQIVLINSRPFRGYLVSTKENRRKKANFLTSGQHLSQKKRYSINTDFARREYCNCFFKVWWYNIQKVLKATYCN